MVTVKRADLGDIPAPSRKLLRLLKDKVAQSIEMTSQKLTFQKKTTGSPL